MRAHTELSDRVSKDLKRRGMSFVGTTIIYAFLQAVGVVNDHELSCFCHPNHLSGFPLDRISLSWDTY